MRILLLLLAFCGCAHVQEDQTVCAESRGVRCLTRTVCAMDERRAIKTLLRP